MHKSSPLLIALLISITVAPVFAASDIMPAPNRAPRTGVASEKLSGSSAANEAPAAMMGTAIAVDGATIRIHDSARDVTARLIGVVAPPLTTPEGASARVALDGILKNQTLDCTRRDRDRDGSLVMSCSFGGGRDLSEAMLFTGTALFSRNGAVDNDLAVRYRAAEETAQMRRTGLWAQVPATSAASAAPAVKTAAPAPAATTSNNSTPIISLTGTNTTPQPVAENIPTPKSADESSFAFIAWLEALGLLGLLFGMLMLLDHRHTRRARLTHELDIRSDRQILAAALTGELAAARDICEARAALITNGGTPTWPRLRTYIYQAHAEQIGLLGAVLARQVASIYGQMADYGASNRGASYGNESDLTTPASVSRALVRLCGYIEITLEGLAEVEHTGEPYYPAEDMAEQKHASQIAQRTQQSTQQALPQTAPRPTKVALKRIGRFDLNERDINGNDDNGDGNGDGGQPAAVPTVRKDNPTPAAAKLTVKAETPAPVPVKTPAAPIEKTATATAAPVEPVTDTEFETPVVEAITEPFAESAADPATDKPAVKQTLTPTAASRAARRAALQQKARAGSLFKAEQALAETNAAIGVDENEAVEASKTA